MVRINKHLLLFVSRVNITLLPQPNDKGPVAVDARVVLQVDLQADIYLPQSHTKIESISKCILLH